MFSKDQEYNLTYINNEGKETEKTITPEKDMSKPEMIMKLKELDNNFYKLLDKVKESKEMEEKEMNNLAKSTKIIKEDFEDLEDVDIEEEISQKESTTKNVTAQFKEAADTDYLIVKIDDEYYVYDINKSIANSDYIYQDKDKEGIRKFIIENSKKEDLEEDYEVLMEEDDNKTLFDLLEDKNFEPVDIIDSITNQETVYYLDIEKADSDAFNNYLSAIAKEIKLIDYNSDTNKATVDLCGYIEKHFDLYIDMFDTSGFLDSGENAKVDQVREIVKNIMPGVLNGCLTDEAYKELTI